MNTDKDISVIVPVFNAGNSLLELHSQLQKAMLSMGKTYEIIFVDDKSSDDSWKVIAQLKQTDTHVKGVKLGRNFGQHNATLCGISRSCGKTIITIDDDLQSSPGDISKLIEKRDATGADLVYAEYTNTSSGLLRRFFTFVYKILLKGISGKNSGRGSSFRLISRELADQLKNHFHEFVFIDELCLWYTDKIEFIKTTKHQSVRKKSNYSNWKLSVISGELALFSTVVPLRAVTVIGGLLAGTSFLLGMYYILRKIFMKVEVEGYTSLIVSVLFSTGLILVALGIIAEYMSKILKSQYRKPAFYIEQEI